jgi:hypothetical protein
MAELSEKAFASFGKISAAQLYRDLGKRLCEELAWEPDRFKNGSPNWASVIAESWKGVTGQTEWVLVGVLQDVLGEIAQMCLVECADARKEQRPFPG